MPGPIFLPLKRYPTTECTINVPRVDPANLAAYGVARPHVDGKMSPPGQPWIGKSKGRKRK